MKDLQEVFKEWLTPFTEPEVLCLHPQRNLVECRITILNNAYAGELRVFSKQSFEVNFHFEGNWYKLRQCKISKIEGYYIYFSSENFTLSCADLLTDFIKPLPESFGPK